MRSGCVDGIVLFWSGVAFGAFPPQAVWIHRVVMAAVVLVMVQSTGFEAVFSVASS